MYLCCVFGLACLKSSFFFSSRFDIFYIHLLAKTAQREKEKVENQQKQENTAQYNEKRAWKLKQNIL